MLSREQKLKRGLIAGVVIVWALVIIQVQGAFSTGSPAGVNKYYTYTVPIVSTHNLGYAPLDYTATDTNGFLTTSEANARKPVATAGVIKEFLVNVSDNSFNGPTVVKIHINGGEKSTCKPDNTSCSEHDGQPVKVVIPAGEKGIFDFGSINIGYRSGDQITFVLDTQGSSAGSMSFVARLGVVEYPEQLNFLLN